jgi:hypothetical protein
VIVRIRFSDQPNAHGQSRKPIRNCDKFVTIPPDLTILWVQRRTLPDLWSEGHVGRKVSDPESVHLYKLVGLNCQDLHKCRQ